MTLRWIVIGFAVGVHFNLSEAQETVFEGRVSGALLSRAGTVFVTDGIELLIVDAGGRTVLIDGSFKEITRLAHGGDGDIVIWDDLLSTAFVIDVDGAEKRAVAFERPRFGIGAGEWQFVGLLTGDVGLFEVVFRGLPTGDASNPYRDVVRYITVTTDGVRTVVWNAQGDETIGFQTDGMTTSAPVIFGYGVRSWNDGGSGFVVAQTESNEAFVVDGAGVQTHALPLPSIGGLASSIDIERERVRLIEEPLPNRLREVLGTALAPEQAAEMLAEMSEATNEAIRAAPANAQPPRISELLVDQNRRVWMRRFTFPRAAVAVWDVHPLAGGDRFSVELPTAWRIFDANERLMIVGVEENGAVGRVVSVEINSVAGLERARGDAPG